MLPLLHVAEELAEHARAALDASEVTINRFDVAEDRWTTLVNIGRHGVGEEKFPANEVYSRGRFPEVTRLLEGGEGYVGVLYSADCLPEVARLLALFGKSSCVGAPLVDETGRFWGELYATRDYGRPPFGRDSLALAVQLARRIGPELASQ